jgi:hypothetical protein
MYKFRNAIASFSRSTPCFRGKFQLGKLISNLLSNYNNDRECITTIEMRDGSLMQLDVRSGTEQWPYWTGSYDNETISKLSGCLDENCVVLDIGANIGFYSVALGHQVKVLNGVIHAFEPVKNNFDSLSKNISLNNLERVILTNEIALGDRESSIKMAMASDNKALTGNAVMVKGEIPRYFFKININNMVCCLHQLKYQLHC